MQKCKLQIVPTICRKQYCTLRTHSQRLQPCTHITATSHAHPQLPRAMHTHNCHKPCTQAAAMCHALAAMSHAYTSLPFTSHVPCCHCALLSFMSHVPCCHSRVTCLAAIHESRAVLPWAVHPPVEPYCPCRSSALPAGDVGRGAACAGDRASTAASEPPADCRVASRSSAWRGGGRGGHKMGSGSGWPAGPRPGGGGYRIGSGSGWPADSKSSTRGDA